MYPVDETNDVAVVEERHWWFPPLLGIVAAVVGGVLLVIGIIVVLRGGLGGPMDQPVVRAAGLTHTPLLGLIEIGAGVLIALAGLTDTKASVLFCAFALAVFGVVVIAQTDQLHRRLAVTSTHGWWAIGLAAVLVLATFISPETTHTVQRRRVAHRPVDEVV